MHELQVAGNASNTSNKLESDTEKLKVLFNEMIQMCLWGNATVCWFSRLPFTTSQLHEIGSISVNPHVTGRYTTPSDCG